MPNPASSFVGVGAMPNPIDASAGLGATPNPAPGIDAGASPAPRLATGAPAAHAIHRAPGDEKSFPSFSQGSFDSCGAASVVSALMIWDKQKSDPSAPNNLVVNACNILLTYLSNYRSVVIA